MRAIESHPFHNYFIALDNHSSEPVNSPRFEIARDVLFWSSTPKTCVPIASRIVRRLDDRVAAQCSLDAMTSSVVITRDLASERMVTAVLSRIELAGMVICCFGLASHVLKRNAEVSQADEHKTCSHSS